MNILVKILLSNQGFPLQTVSLFFHRFSDDKPNYKSKN